MKIKTILKKTAENSLEFVKPLGKVVSVDSAVSQVLGTPHGVDIEPKDKNEMTDYIKNIGDSKLNPEDIKKKDAQKVAAQVQDYRKSLELNESTASHIRIPNLKEYRKAKKGIYYELLEEKEQAEEERDAAKAQTPLVVPTSKASPGGLRKKITQEQSSIETKQNRKSQ